MKRLSLAIVISLLLASASARTVTIHTPHESLSLDIADTSPHLMLAIIEPLIANAEDCMIEVSKQAPLCLAAAYRDEDSAKNKRDYSRSVTEQEKGDLKFIINTLSNQSLVTIMLARSDIEQAGDRIAHLHPLRFLMTIFTDEELKVGIRNIRNKAWLWGQFVGGLKQSFSKEQSAGNLTQEQLSHFASTVGINLDLLEPAVKQKDWDLFVDLLITHVPRHGDHDRYDM